MKTAIAALLVIVLFGSCFKKNVNTASTCDYDACAFKVPSGELTQLETYLSGPGVTTAVKHCSGMYYEIIAPGADAAPTVCSYVSVNYKGALTNGTIFDQTTGTPAVIGLPGVISGWKNGVPLIKKGGKIRLYIPPSLGYGAGDTLDPNTHAVIIPGNSILIFDIELLDVQ